jgi:predicted acetyltransferase
VTLPIRAITPDEIDAFVGTFRAVFGGAPDTQDLARARQRLECDRSFVAVDADGEVVATAGAHSFAMSLPGGTQLGCAGITLVSVRADHRRRGVLTGLMDRLLQQARARGDAVAALWASETPIYGRFGFGPAIPTVEITLDRDHAALQLSGPVEDVTLVDRHVAREAFPAIRAQVSASRPGLLARSPGFWDSVLDEESTPPSGTGPRQHALLPGRAYALYRLRPDWTAGAPTGQVVVSELHATDPEAAAAMWRFVTDVDLASSTVAGRRPVDDAVLAMVVDQGRARVAEDWPLQVRLVDLARVLSTRTYHGDGSLVLDVRDRQLPDQDGRWHLEVSAGQGACRRTDRAADLQLDIAALSTVFLGGVRTTQLAAAGRVGQDGSDAAARLDRLLATDVAPWQEFMF